MTLLIVIISQRGGDILEAVYSTMVPREGGGVVGGSRKVRGKGDALYSEFTKGGEREASSRPWRRGNADISGWRGPGEAMRGVACHVAGRCSLEEAAAMGSEGRGGEGRGQGAAAGRWCVLRTPAQHQPVWLESHRGTTSESKMYRCAHHRR